MHQTPLTMNTLDLVQKIPGDSSDLVIIKKMVGHAVEK